MKIINSEFKNEVSTNNTPVFILKAYKPRKLARTCNLCDEEFHPRSKFDRFCEKCRVESELYHFAEWLSA